MRGLHTEPGEMPSDEDDFENDGDGFQDAFDREFMAITRGETDVDSMFERMTEREQSRRRYLIDRDLPL